MFGLQKSKNKVGLLLGLAGLSVAIAFVAAWATGLVRVSLPGFVGPPQPSRPEEISEETATDLTDQERRLLKGLSGEEKKRQIRKLRDAPRASAPADVAGGGARGWPPRTRRQWDLAHRSAPELNPRPRRAHRRSSATRPDVPVPPVDGTLDPVALRKVVGRQGRSRGLLGAEHRPITEEIRIEFLVTVRPTGSVSEVVLRELAVQAGDVLGLHRRQDQRLEVPCVRWRGGSGAPALRAYAGLIGPVFSRPGTGCGSR